MNIIISIFCIAILVFSIYILIRRFFKRKNGNCGYCKGCDFSLDCHNCKTKDNIEKQE